MGNGEKAIPTTTQSTCGAGGGVDGFRFGEALHEVMGFAENVEASSSL